MSETEYTLCMNCGITFAGIKPASLVCIKKENIIPFENTLLKFNHRGFSYTVLRETRERFAVFTYQTKKLEKILFNAEIIGFLGGYGYNYSTVTEAIETLKERMKSDDFPHEVGVFLGYPLSDVKGFIDNPLGGAVGYWKVYDNIEQKQELFKRFRRCTNCIYEKLLEGKSFTAIFNVG